MILGHFFNLDISILSAEKGKEMAKKIEILLPEAPVVFEENGELTPAALTFLKEFHAAVQPLKEYKMEIEGDMGFAIDIHVRSGREATSSFLEEFGESDSGFLPDEEGFLIAVFSLALPDGNYDEVRLYLENFQKTGKGLYEVFGKVIEHLLNQALVPGIPEKLKKALEMLRS